MSESAPPENKKKPISNSQIYVNGFIVLIIAFVIVLVLFFVGVGSPLKSYAPTAASASIYAIFYLLAQFDERLVEPFSNTRWFGYSSSDQTDDSQKKAAPNAKPKTTPVDDATKQARIVALWCFASGIGIVLCYVTVGLLQVVGVTAAGSSNLGHLGDAVFSGLIIGGGTKPLHDLINLFDNSSNKKPSTTS